MKVSHLLNAIKLSMREKGFKNWEKKYIKSFKDCAFGLLGKYLTFRTTLKKQNLEIVSSAMRVGFMQVKWQVLLSVDSKKNVTLH